MLGMSAVLLLVVVFFLVSPSILPKSRCFFRSGISEMSDMSSVLLFLVLFVVLFVMFLPIDNHTRTLQKWVRGSPGDPEGTQETPESSQETP